MESVSIVSNLLEANWDDDCKKSLKKHKLNFIFLFVISTIVIILLCVNTVLLEEKRNTRELLTSDCIQWKCVNSTYIPPKCSYVDKYPLSDEVYLRICQSDGDVLIDIRLFKDEEGTSDGIQITKMQWQYLKNSIAHIDSSIMRISHWIYFVIIISFNDEHRRFTVVLKRLSKVGLRRFVCHSAVSVELYPQSVIYTPHKVIKYNQNKWTVQI